MKRTIKHGKESKWHGLTTFEFKMNFKSIGYRVYKATINLDGTIRSFHMLRKVF